MTQDVPGSLEGTHLSRVISGFVDPVWYRQRYPDTGLAGLDPVQHFLRHGFAEGRDPNEFFDSAWYRKTYKDAAAGGAPPLMHYLLSGIAEMRKPHPRFDADFYTHQHPKAASNPLLFHLHVGRTRGYPTEQPFRINDYLPSEMPPPRPPNDVAVDVVIPVQGRAETAKRCLTTVLANSAAMPGRIIVIDDCCRDPALITWLQQCAAESRIKLLRNNRAAGFAASANRGIEEAGDHDVVVLSSDTEVAAGWLPRLAAHAYAASRIAVVSPLTSMGAIDGAPGESLPFGHTLDQIDEVCRTVNSGRTVDVPAVQPGCVYIRRTALNELGVLDAMEFRHGYGAVTDFCLRAKAKGWTHRLACDTFAHRHPPKIADPRANEAEPGTVTLLRERYPGHARHLARTVRFSALAAYRFAITAALFRLSKLPVLLMVTGGISDDARQHIHGLIARLSDEARFLLLERAKYDAAVSVPALPGLPPVILPADRDDWQEQLLRAMHVSRIHLHDQDPAGPSIKPLIQRLGLPFDATVHDYLAICPQRNLLPWPSGLYCGEPGPARCNACIADRGDADHGARDILSWRLEHAWLFRDADRVICLSHDAQRRLQRYGLADRAVIAQLGGKPGATWPLTMPPYPGRVLRIVVLGPLTDQKGARLVAAVAEASRHHCLDIRLIGRTDDSFPESAMKLVKQTGRNDPADLPDLIRQAKPHAFWFASTAPEASGVSLDMAIETGLPIVATDLGAFTECLAGRPLTWLVDHRATPDDLVATFESLRQVLIDRPDILPAPRRTTGSDFYARNYLATSRTGRRAIPRSRRILALPARQADGSIAPSGYMRLLQPLDHPAIGGEHRLELADASSFMQQTADMIIVQPSALPDVKTAATLLHHARQTGARLVLDLDADPAESGCAPKVLRQLLQAADAIWVASGEIAQRIGAVAAPVTLLETALDERLWQPPLAPARRWEARTRILWAGVHAEDFAVVEAAL
ncbi:MAG TPA: glycosyltransferase, partial [Rhodopila sp.]|nr:glycosyltransferase [Rhodopila sp.]